MPSYKESAELIRKLEKLGYCVVPHARTRCKVIVGEKEVIIPGPRQRVSGSALRNARATLRRELGIEI